MPILCIPEETGNGLIKDVQQNPLPKVSSQLITITIIIIIIIVFVVIIITENIK